MSGPGPGHSTWKHLPGQSPSWGRCQQKALKGETGARGLTRPANVHGMTAPRRSATLPSSVFSFGISIKKFYFFFSNRGVDQMKRQKLPSSFYMSNSSPPNTISNHRDLEVCQTLNTHRKDQHTPSICLGLVKSRVSFLIVFCNLVVFFFHFQSCHVLYPRWVSMSPFRTTVNESFRLFSYLPHPLLQ